MSGATQLLEIEVLRTMTDLIGDRRTVQQVLADCRAVVAPALRAAVDGLPGPVQKIAGYHFGWLDKHGRSADASGGKMIRSAMALLSAQVVGGRTQTALPAAVTVELAHNFSLLHDDVMDHDRFRHHRPTAWAVYRR